ncbi:50S ribosomal protein L25/general stress protein Ctc [Hyphobacterium sp. SN044]|uniref:50S ribosomal protein L25/general stress protein Ctc n=1 Tax=Hyphobacterium sp. SN044 TaxID=2912575 RepID=UPI001F018A09|nr:50S ribosomal protein L25/general stress protein Ctc [Hyphobacterium sp. SN044]MCF8878261.1 50S ribosomal protein L25/general stress protein Ctc [Hyphobacterium sp. SN044]
MSDIVLPVEVREGTGKGAARAARREGLVPGVLYGGDRGAVSIAVKANVLRKAIHTGKFLSHMVTLEHGKEKQPVIPKDVQFHPVTDEPLHIDLFRVEEDTVIDVEVTVHFINEEKSPGLKRGGVLNVVRHAVELSCPAGSIPEEIVIDLSGKEIGDSIHISDVTLPEGVTPTITDRDFTIATLQGARVMVESEEGEAEESEDADEAEVEAAEGEEGESED